MVFALSTGFLFTSKHLGLLAMLYSFTVVSLPRVYLGYHYSTDIIAGALIGMLVAGLMGWQAIRQPLAHYPVVWSKRHPSLFYFLFFLLTCEIALVFENARQMITFSLSL
jgi:undecaprenyl-diphosphatase